METENKPKITLFHCINSFRQGTDTLFERCEVKVIKMPCSSMTKDVYLLRAFEAGADAVLVFAYPKNRYRYVEGSKRSKFLTK